MPSQGDDCSSSRPATWLSKNAAEFNDTNGKYAAGLGETRMRKLEQSLASTVDRADSLVMLSEFLQNENELHAMVAEMQDPSNTKVKKNLKEAAAELLHQDEINNEKLRREIDGLREEKRVMQNDLEKKEKKIIELTGRAMDEKTGLPQSDEQLLIENRALQEKVSCLERKLLKASRNLQVTNGQQAKTVAALERQHDKRLIDAETILEGSTVADMHTWLRCARNKQVEGGMRVFGHVVKAKSRARLRTVWMNWLLSWALERATKGDVDAHNLNIMAAGTRDRGTHLQLKQAMAQIHCLKAEIRVMSENKHVHDGEERLIKEVYLGSKAKLREARRNINLADQDDGAATSGESPHNPPRFY